jgi:hypothetical protein
MKSLLVVLLLAGAAVAYAGETSKTTCAVCQEAKKSAKAAVTGSNIPVEVDKTGRPTKSTLKVNVVDENAIRVYGFGSPTYVLGKLPMVYSASRR